MPAKLIPRSARKSSASETRTRIARSRIWRIPGSSDEASRCPEASAQAPTPATPGSTVEIPVTTPGCPPLAVFVAGWLNTWQSGVNGVETDWTRVDGARPENCSRWVGLRWIAGSRVFCAIRGSGRRLRRRRWARGGAQEGQGPHPGGGRRRTQAEEAGLYGRPRRYVGKRLLHH